MKWICRNGHLVKHQDFTNPAYCPQCRRIKTRKERKANGTTGRGRILIKRGILSIAR